MIRNLPVLLLLVALATPAEAAKVVDTAICGGTRIYVGQSKFDVLEQCGAPDMINTIGTRKVTRAQTNTYGSYDEETELYILEWIYTKRDYVFTIIGNKVTAISEL